MKKNHKVNLLLFLLLFVATCWIINRNRPSQMPYQRNSGFIFGTIYNVTYQHDKDIQKDIEQVLHHFDGSLSMFNDTSVISRINRGEDLSADRLLKRVFLRSMQISQATGGAFDITCAPLVNAWGFGFKKGLFPDSAQVDSLLQFVGYRKIRLTPADKIEKTEPRTMLDCSAIAKGYAVDIVADYLQSQGIRNFMVDIGGEVVVRGVNPHHKLWHIGINKPEEDSLSLTSSMQSVLAITDAGIATSGNYRNYYYRDGVRYAHTIDPRIGYPVQHSILSSTVVAKDCMTADAYATAFMVMGFDEARRFVESHDSIDVCFIYLDSLQQRQVYYSPDMKQYLKP